jgi:predicted transcriptional regulator
MSMTSQRCLNRSNERQPSPFEGAIVINETERWSATETTKGIDAVAKKAQITLDRDQQILSRLGKIEHKVDSMDQTQAFALRAEAAKHFATVKTIFRNSKRRAQVYLAADGSRGVQEIAEHLGMQRQNVGPDLRVLADEGMLEISDTSGGRDIWGKKPIDRTLRISQFLRNEFSLGADGRPASGSKTKSSGRKTSQKRR